ncbi:hypothetical protein VOLCADRAFT_86996 [Volvox carteri f. nagariensis]|uniref:Uncharacterized protein n=1 Tax=Volvox carteri f. nagariensis TaxID=3068 RepID=D8TJW6_VOLCA|nr:uncharacterized protein VOLCADRAFT_86996 [Volvox carteri f. nagariensis]EFJ51960.1 hypothetical protein VOLCADRAFT_86996 [Volvox carteri f. nagariensis]|eukprot:XP_002946734.1 hypothetical protein VOLCADRAFT_86996 [Volvox carteri f. nagariensis]
MEKVGAICLRNFVAVKVCGLAEDSCSISTQRSSGGGAKLCTLDMQSYLEVMGRQLDEIQAQHHQDGLPPEYPPPLGFCHSHGEREQLGSPCIGDSSGALPSSSASQSVEDGRAIGGVTDGHEQLFAFHSLWHSQWFVCDTRQPQSGLSTDRLSQQQLASVDFYQNAGFRGVASEVELLSEVASESDVSPYPIALPGRPFDGIDSEEDDVVQPAGNSYAGGSTNARCTAQALPDDLVGPRGEQPDDVSDQRVVQQLVMQQQPLPPAACTDSRPQSGASARAPLVVASLETEEALRALLATPRFAMSRSDNVATSIDVEGLEVPAEVLAALAKTDGMDLDAALGAAMAVSLREHPSLPLTPPAKQTQGTAGVGQTGQGRQMVLGPGALTAAPVTVSPGGAVRGFETSKRSAGGASVRAASIAGPMPSVVPPPRDAGHPKQQADRPSAPIDASFEVDRLDMLSQTVEISMEGALSTTDSAVFAALASAQAAVAQQHSQPVLYSLAPKPTLPVDKGSRRNTSDGESRRVTIDAGSRCTLGGGGGSRRNTADGGALIFEFSDAGQMNGKEHPHSRVHSAAPTADPTVTAGVSNAGRPDMRPVGASPSVGGTVSGHGGAGNSSGRAPDGVAAAASPVRGFRGGANVVSPSAASSIMRQGGDGDMVLFGSPSQKGDAGASPSPSTSPYVPPSPPPGADPSPYISSPTVTHMGSRLQRNSRKMDEEAVTGVRHDAEAEHGQLGVDGGVGRQLRMQGLQHHVSLHKQYSDQQVVPAPAEVTPPSTSSLPTEVSPPSRHATGVVSPGTVVEGMGCPAMTFPATRGSTAAKSGLAEPSGHSSDSNQTSRPQLQSLGLQLAAFSRAAALAAAVDVGIAPPPPAVERRPAPPTVLSVNTRSASVEPVASVTPDASATSRESDTGKLNVAGLNVTGDASTAAGLQSRGLGKPARNTYGQGDIAADGRHLYLGHPELVQGQLLVAISSAPTQGAVTEARAPLACSKKEATIANVLNLTHENSDVTVANEAGQVKWAWQTDAKGKPGPGRLDTTVAVPPSPSSCNNSSGSPWASPAAASAVVRDSGAEWALQQLPPPQWQRHGQVPAGTHANKLQHERPKQNAEGKPPLPQPQQQSCQYADGRRQSDCMIADRPATDAGADTNPYAISAGGVSAQEQNQLRATSATEGGGQPNSKALALLRLKQQSIMRHNAHVSTINE